VFRRVQGPTILNQSPDLVVARWTDTEEGTRRARICPRGDQFVLDIALVRTRLRLTNGRQTIFDGMMASGMTYICRPGQTLQAELSGPADFLRLCAGGHLFVEPHQDPSAPIDLRTRAIATMLHRDPLIEQLARAVQTVGADVGAAYIDTLGRAIVARTSRTCRRNPRISPLPAWRLKRVIDHIEANIAGVITPSDLAAAAGLSRTHFTAQFKLATGCKPHEFVLVQRIEMAKQLLAGTSEELVDVALSVGFQAQAHFSTVFKRFVGDTPGRWRKSQLAGLDEDWRGLSNDARPVGSPFAPSEPPGIVPRSAYALVQSR
jgi:AraC-like DNA-binding protein